MYFNASRGSTGEIIKAGDLSAIDNCGPAFDAYVGKVYEESELDIYWFYPLSDGWNDGDRSVRCAASHPRIQRLTESIKGSNR